MKGTPRTLEEFEEQLRFVSDMPAPSGNYDKSARARAARGMGAVEETNPVSIDDEIDEEVKPKKKKKQQKEVEEGQYAGLAIEESRPPVIEDSNSHSVEHPREADQERAILINSAMRKEPAKSAMKKYKPEEDMVDEDSSSREKKKSKSKKEKKPKSEREEFPQPAEKAKKKKKKKKLESEDDAAIEEALIQPEKTKKKKTKKPDESSQPVEREIRPDEGVVAPVCCTIL
jgi:hypothetical protein